jgi:hypothetical protein
MMLLLPVNDGSIDARRQPDGSIDVRHDGAIREHRCAARPHRRIRT